MNEQDFDLVTEIAMKDIHQNTHRDTVIDHIDSDQIPKFDSISLVRVILDCDFKRGDLANIVFCISDSSHKHEYVWCNPRLIHFSEQGFDKWQTGFFNFGFNAITDHVKKTVCLKLSTKNLPDDLKHIRLQFFKAKKKPWE